MRLKYSFLSPLLPSSMCGRVSNNKVPDPSLGLVNITLYMEDRIFLPILEIQIIIDFTFDIDLI